MQTIELNEVKSGEMFEIMSGFPCSNYVTELSERIPYQMCSNGKAWSIEEDKYAILFPNLNVRVFDDSEVKVVEEMYGI